MMNTSINIELEAFDRLKELIDVNTHSHVIYQYFSSQIDNPGIQSELQLIADERAAQAMGLDRILENFNPSRGSAEKVSGISVKHLHPCWTGVKDALGGNDTFLALEELEKGELCIEEAYRSVLALDLPPSVHLMVESHASAVCIAHRRMASLRDAAKPRQ